MILSESIEDYLKAIYALKKEVGKVVTTQLAERLEVKPASVTGMVRKLAQMKLVTYKPYQGVALTKAGQKVALEVIRHHRLLELYLSEVMGLPWDKVHIEAEKLEHALSEELEERIDELLGHPTTDPHGAPIPTKAGKVNSSVSHKLSELKQGEKAKIAEVRDEDSELLRYLGDLGLFPREVVTVVAVAPFKGPMTLQLKQREVVVGREAAKQILVNKISAWN
ncbi:MAG: metal-dependent transcriptional regulator [candidate division Zixibacteria bacterium]|nr:metal-dependent transcriptional regulator [candidate division Zixibacteria bacterium]